MLIQNKHWGSTIGIIFGPLSLFLWIWFVDIITTIGLVPLPHPGLRCDAGQCTPFFILTISFGALAYKARKHQKFIAERNPKKSVWLAVEIISIALVLLSAATFSTNEDPTMAGISWIALIWVGVSYLMILFAKPFSNSSRLTK